MIWSLQILRFIAAMMIAIIHASNMASTYIGSSGFISIEIGYACMSGVDIFFVISGVVISISAKGLSGSDFLWRRARRVLPIYWAACIVFLIPATQMFSIPLGWRDVVATLFLWPATDVMTDSLLPVAWTLTFELMFYACAALVIRDRKWIYILLGLYAVAFCLRSISPTFKIIGSPLVIEFLLGVLIARLPMMRSAIWGIPIGFTAILATACLKLLPFGTWPFSDKGEVARLIFFGLPAALIVYGVMQIEATKGFWTYLGEMSYSLYLFHVLPIWILFLLVHVYPLPANVIVPIALLVSVLFSWRAHVLIELPLLRSIPKQYPARAAGNRVD